MKDLLVFIAMEDTKSCQEVQDILKQFEGINFITYKNGKSCVEEFYKNPQLIIFSIKLPDMTGSVMIKKIKRYDPSIEMVFVTPERQADQVPQLLNLGALSFINRDRDGEDRIADVLRNTLQSIHLKSELKRLRFEVGKKYKYTSVIRGKCQWMQELYASIDKAARSAIPVSLYGEAGTGKKLIAKTIHFHSSFSEKPFVRVDLGVIPENLIETELFGSERVTVDKAREIIHGRFEEAQRGTLYLREIEKLTPMMQEKLARVLREKIFFRVGAENPLKFNSRVIVSSRENLLDYVNRGDFNEDLYYMLLGMPIRVLPLRERDSDITYIARHFANKFCLEHHIPKLTITPLAYEKLMNYPFPGNIRELKAITELACVMADGNPIDETHINFFNTNPMANLLLKENTMNEYTRQIIKNFMEKYDNDIMVVANKLDIGKSTIYRMKKNGEI